MAIYTDPPEWEDAGKKPPSSKRTEGWKPGDRVPASWLNWFWFSTVQSLREIAQAFVSHRDNRNNPHKVTADQIGAATPEYVQHAINQAVAAALPVGIIVQWSGSVDSIPAGFALCDGTRGTPDLRDKFVLGAGGSYAPGDTGGSSRYSFSHTHKYSGSTSGGLGAHTTSGFGGSTSIAPGHTHTYSGETDSALADVEIMPPYYALAYIMRVTT